jgi:hypothetical protein
MPDSVIGSTLVSGTGSEGSSPSLAAKMFCGRLVKGISRGPHEPEYRVKVPDLLPKVLMRGSEPVSRQAHNL